MRLLILFSSEWLQNDHLGNVAWSSPGMVQMIGEKYSGSPIDEATLGQKMMRTWWATINSWPSVQSNGEISYFFFTGWCPVDCDGVFKTFMLCMFLLSILGSTGRIGEKSYKILNWKCVNQNVFQKSPRKRFGGSAMHRRTRQIPVYGLERCFPVPSGHAPRAYGLRRHYR